MRSASRDRQLIATLLIALLALAGCRPAEQSPATGNYEITYDLQAPYDGYVCYQESYNDCMSTLGSTNQSFGQIWTSNFTPYPYVPAPIYHADDCPSGVFMYKQTRDPEQPALAVLLSPPLIAQIKDDIFNIGMTQQACERISEDRKYDQEVLAYKIGTLHIQQNKVDFLTRAMEKQEREKNNVGQSEITVNGQHSTPPYTENVELFQAQRELNSLSYEFAYKETKKKMEMEYPRALSDAQLAISTANRRLDRDLFYRDQGIIDPAHDARYPRFWITYKTVKTFFPNGAWVRKGTVIARVTRHDEWELRDEIRAKKK